jgi:molybdopterin converting factor small subunit
MGLVTIEFFGIPRQRAGRAELAVAAGTVSELLASVEQSCPGLKGLRQADGRLSPHYLLSIDGQQFVTDLRQEVRPGERLLLLSADAGG